MKNDFQIPKIFVYDVTLRDGEQASGFHMYPEEKIRYAQLAAEMGVDGIEAGFAKSSPGDEKTIREIAKRIGKEESPVISSLARAKKEDIEAAARAVEPAHHPRIHYFIATSDQHINAKFKKTKNWVIDRVIEEGRRAKRYVDDVQFSCEDFARTDPDYTVDVICAAIDAGATTINMPDTVGCFLPNESHEFNSYVIDKVRSRGYDAVFSVHDHDDMGMSTANTVEAIRGGARQVEVTTNGIGERAGNCALEEIVAVMNVRGIGKCNIDTTKIGEASRMISKFTEVNPQPNKAIVGKNAFSHEAGIHQAGMMKDKSTYEIMDPRDYGLESTMTFGPRSGRNALKSRYETMGIEMDQDEFQKTVERFTDIADQVKEVDDADLLRAYKNEEVPQRYSFVGYEPDINSRFGNKVVIKGDGNDIESFSHGNGQIDAAVNAVKKAIGNPEWKITDYNTEGEGAGSDATAYSKIEMSNEENTVIGTAENPDVVSSIIMAYIDCCNRMDYVENNL